DAARSLGEIGDRRAVEFLLLALDHLEIRPVAVEALGKIGDRRAVPALIAIVNGSGGPDTSRPLEGCGDRWDQEMVVMGLAVRALGTIRDEAAVPALVDALQNTVTRAVVDRVIGLFGVH